VIKLPLALGKSSPDPNTQAVPSLHKTGIGNVFFWRKPKMNARPQVREILIAKKMKHWWVVAKCRLIDPTCPTWRARKNYARLCARYPEIMQRLGLHEFPAY
jgi:hypothetical protein